MRTITLSDHTAEVVQRQQDERAAFEKSCWDEYRQRVQLHEEKKAMAVETLRLTWDRFGFSFRLIPALYGWLTARRAVRPSPPAIYNWPSEEENKWNAGNEGENLVHSELENQLGDDWTLFKGYRNSKGEIDFVVVGPPGIVALEVKHRNGVVNCDGDNWWSDKFDNYGNLVGQGRPMKEKGGRSPARQVNESADKLQAFLSSRGVNRRIMRIVVLSHPKGWVGNCSNLTIDWVLRSDHLDFRSLQYPGKEMAGAELTKVVELIQRDHRHHNERRQQRRALATNALATE
jgi:hypothetical protein